MKINIHLFFIALIMITACSSSKETISEDKTEEEIYIFDDIEKDALELENKIIEETKNFVYTVQVGAFTTKEKAEKFVKDNQFRLEQKMNVVFKNEINLYAVQLPELSTREEAEVLRNNLWQVPEFNDAFIITYEK